MKSYISSGAARMGMKYRKLGIWLMAGGLLLIAAALLLTGYNLWDEERAGRASQEILMQMPGYQSGGADLFDTGTDMEMEHSGAGVENSAGAEGGYEGNSQVIPDYLLNPDLEMPVAEIDGNDYIGVLSIPALGVELPVMSDWTMEKLKLSPCRYSGSAYTRNLVIAGHNYRKHFSGLKTMSPGDRIVFTDMAGNRLVYEVAERETLNPDETSRMTDSGWDLSLFTCTYGGQARFTLRCRLLP